MAKVRCDKGFVWTLRDALKGGGGTHKFFGTSNITIFPLKRPINALRNTQTTPKAINP